MRYIRTFENIKLPILMKYIKVFEKVNRKFNIGDIVIWNDINNTLYSSSVRVVKFGDPCEIIAVKNVKGEPYVKAKIIKTDKPISKLWNNSGRIVNHYDGSWFEDSYFIPAEEFKWTIFSAVKSDNIEKSKELIKTVPVDIRDNNGNPPIFYAVHRNNLDIVILLIKAGANFDLIDEDDTFVFEYLNKENQEQIKKLFPKKYEDYLITKNSEKYNL